MKKIAVLGGGVAGIKSAIELAKNNKSMDYEIHLFESKHSLGGRMYSLVDNFTGEEIDNGQHLMIGAYEHFLALIDDLDAGQYLDIQESLSVSFLSKKFSTELTTSYLPGKAGMLLGFLMLSGVSVSSKYQALRFFMQMMLGKVLPENKSAFDLLEEYKQSSDFIKLFWNPFILAVFNARPEQVPAELLLNVLKRTMLADTKNSSLILPKVGLGQLLGNAEETLKKMGVVLHLSESVQSIKKEERAFMVETRDSNYEFDYLISALAPDALTKVLRENHSKTQLFKSIQEYKYSPISSIYLWFDREFMKEKFVGVIDSPIQWIFNRRKLCGVSQEIGDKYPGHITITISASEEIVSMDKEVLIELLIDELKEYYPKAQQARLLYSKIIHAKKATLLINEDTFRPSTISGVDGLFLAGDWTDTGLPATLEGAAQSGVSAIRMLNSKF
jgi:squalene-associated FAD-dependent desaturase